MRTRSFSLDMGMMGMGRMMGRGGMSGPMLVDPGSAVRVITEFADFADPQRPYMYHCHILEHEDAGMMGQFVVV